MDWIDGCLSHFQHFRLYHGGQFYWRWKPENPEETGNLRQVTDVLPNMQWLEACNNEHGALITFATEVPIERRRPASDWVRSRRNLNLPFERPVTLRLDQGGHLPCDVEGGIRC